jgi:hypothetical protein
LVSSSSSYATKQIFLKMQIRLVMENREFAEDWVFITLNELKWQNPVIYT